MQDAMRGNNGFLSLSTCSMDRSSKPSLSQSFTPLSTPNLAKWACSVLSSFVTSRSHAVTTVPVCSVNASVGDKRKHSPQSMFVLMYSIALGRNTAFLSLDPSSGADAGLERRGFVRLVRQARARRARPRGSGGMPPPETFWISDLLRSLLVQSGGEILGRRTCCTCHARNRSSSLLNYASNFRSGNFTCFVHAHQ